MKVYQALLADPISTRTFLGCSIVCRKLWLKVQLGNEFLE